MTIKIIDDKSVVSASGTTHDPPMILLLLLATVLSKPVQATARTQAAPNSAPTPPAASSAAASEAGRQLEKAVVTEQTAYRTLPVAGGAGPNLAIRIALEQAMRRAIDRVMATLAVADRAVASMLIWQRIGAVDAANTAYVKSILPADGWFRNSRDGEEVAHDAWLIVQHSPDQAFQTAVLARMRPLVGSGEARGGDYALLYDRTEMFAGRPQLYGSQMTCSGGRWQAAPTVDPADLDRRRAEMGQPPMVEYLKNFQGSC